jgi:glycosyltransferase involved in cell wall biosynthesis
MKLISIIVPVLNEAANIERLCDAVNRVLEPIADRYAWELIGKHPEGMRDGV